MSTMCFLPLFYRRNSDMEKIICEICGTSYPETESSCPVCGCSRDFSLDDFGTEAAAGSAVPVSGRKKNKEIFDFDEVNSERRPIRRELDEDDFEEEEEEEEEAGTNVFLVVVLVILIVLLLLTAGFFFVRYFLPNLTDKPEQTEAIVTTVPAQTEPVETTAPGIPCTDIVIPGGKVELGKDGMWLLNVQVFPENTTDTLQYVSDNESVATVSGDGTVTAVGEGTAVITITCGEKQIHCNVTVDYSVSEETAPEGDIPAPQVDENADSTQAAEETQATEPETTEDATDAAEETSAAGQELKLKKNDISIFSNYTSVKLELDCDIAPEDINWFTMDSTVAIVHDGVITSTGSGMTRIYGEYGGQQVECIVRCPF